MKGKALESIKLHRDTYSGPMKEEVFSMEEINLLRQWYNAVEDLNPKYLERKDRLLNEKIVKLLWGEANK